MYVSQWKEQLTSSSLSEIKASGGKTDSVAKACTILAFFCAAWHCAYSRIAKPLRPLWAPCLQHACRPMCFAAASSNVLADCRTLSGWCSSNAGSLRHSAGAGETGTAAAGGGGMLQLWSAQDWQPRLCSGLQPYGPRHLEHHQRPGAYLYRLLILCSIRSNSTHAEGALLDVLWRLCINSHFCNEAYKKELSHWSCWVLLCFSPFSRAIISRAQAKHGFDQRKERACIIMHHRLCAYRLCSFWSMCVSTWP